MAKKNFTGGLSQLLGNNSDSLELTILPELHAFIPPLTDNERVLLKESIEKDGIKEPLDIWLNDGKAIVIDGHNRYSIAVELKVKYTTKEHDFENIQEVKDWMLKKQLGRRNLSDANRNYLIGLLYNKEKGEKGKYERSNSSNTAESIAEHTGSSVRTVKSAGSFAEGMDKLTPELKKHILAGNEKVNQKDIQKLASSDVTKPISSVEQLSQEVEKVVAKKAEKIKDKAVLTPILDVNEEETQPRKEIHNEIISGAENEELNDEESVALYAETKQKFIKHFGDVSNVIVSSVIQDMLRLYGGMSDHIKLANDGYIILRTADSPSIHIKYFSAEKASWKTYEKDFDSKAARDRRFNTLLTDKKTIRG